MRTRVRRSRALLFGLGLFVFLLPSTMFAATSSTNISAAGANGTGVSDQPGVACADGGSGASWDYTYGAALPAGMFSSLPGNLTLQLELHSEAVGVVPTYDGAWLPPDQSRVVIQNSRGSLELTLASGSGACGEDTFFFDGTTASGSGTWLAENGLGSYRQATGSGTFSLTANVGPGADNPFQISLNGPVTVLDPSLATDVAQASWDRANEDGFHHAIVVYRITNSGPGDAFGVRLTNAATSTPGVELVGPVPQSLGDLAAGESALVEVRYRMAKKRDCHTPGEGGCVFDVLLTVEMSDALDVVASYSEAESVHVPTPARGNSP